MSPSLSRDSAHAKSMATAKQYLTAIMIGLVACATLASFSQIPEKKQLAAGMSGDHPLPLIP